MYVFAIDKPKCAVIFGSVCKIELVVLQSIREAFVLLCNAMQRPEEKERLGLVDEKSRDG